MNHQGRPLRHEYKFFLTKQTYLRLRERIKPVLQPDENMRQEEGYVVSSLYFDDMHHSAKREKIDGVRFREKFRIRIYDHNDTFIKLENKAKYDDLTAKTSTRLSRAEYDQILQEDDDFLLQRDELFCTNFYGLRKIKLLRPATIVEYTREAYLAEAGNVRITFDKAIAASLHGQDLFAPDLVLSPVLPPGILVMEVKYDDFLPRSIHQLIADQGLQRFAISKYVLCQNRRERVRQHD
ncbi:MAG: polyphosphate polymerase domain-containing protein [Eubacteriales bacterium]|nr:polyphosphate polymerase domain-containing protein [Eubacteriales bacterium]